jgi:hypothetical protein
VKRPRALLFGLPDRVSDGEDENDRGDEIMKLVRRLARSDIFLGVGHSE